MIKEKIIVSDANIFFDLISIKLLNEFFKFGCEIHTTDFVLNEIKNPTQRKAIQCFINSGHLVVKSFDNLLEISRLKTKGISFADTSVIYYTKTVSGRLLSGDKKLKSVAEKMSISVSGILYVFDNLVEYNIITKEEASEKLQKLIKINQRLPQEECAKRIKNWHSF